MKILMVNKFLYPNGGSETYIFKLGEEFVRLGHKVEYFGMEHIGRIVGNRAESYTGTLDFHTGKLEKLLYPFKIIYSTEARHKIRKVLEDFMPDVVHLNNFNFQLTPSIIYEIRAYDKKRGKKTALIYTAHDYQWICPNHMFRIPAQGELCMRCAEGKYLNCAKYRCIHNSRAKSILGSVEGSIYYLLKTYQKIDKIICPSEFMNRALSRNRILKGNTVTLHNFIDAVPDKSPAEKKDYVLYLGRYAEEKGVRTLAEVCRELPDIPFLFAGSGPLKEELAACPNISEKGFLSGGELTQIIREARFMVFPSEWYENCPFSVMEAQMYGTPVLAADIGGTPELLQNGVTGELFASGNKADLKEKIRILWENKELCQKYAKNCRNITFDTLAEYAKKLIKIYGQELKSC